MLVDGGHSGRKLAASLSTYAADVSKIDVVVCTHGDRDHAGGLADFLDHWRVKNSDGSEQAGEVGQFWLPGAWVDVLPKVLEEPGKLKFEIVKALDDFVARNPKLNSDTGIDDDFHSQIEDLIRSERNWTADGRFRMPDSIIVEEHSKRTTENDLDATEPLDEPEWLKSLRARSEIFQKGNVKADKEFDRCRRSIRRRIKSKSINKALGSFWMRLVETLPSIRRIAVSAFRRNIRIRWFDYDAFLKSGIARGGASGFLVPLNSNEQAPAPQPGILFLHRLSPVNEASLVFLAPPSDDHLGVVFSGDSPLGDGPRYAYSFLSNIRKPRFPLISTAPHHGSENNCIAYGHLLNWAQIMIWLRTGGDKRHPGDTFKAFNFPGRVCSHCPQTGKRLQLAGVSGPMSWNGSSPPTLKAISIIGHHCSCV